MCGFVVVRVRMSLPDSASMLMASRPTHQRIEQTMADAGSNRGSKERPSEVATELRSRRKVIAPFPCLVNSSTGAIGTFVGTSSEVSGWAIAFAPS